MQINRINSTNFGAVPDMTTKYYLKVMTEAGIDTQKTMTIMRDIYANNLVVANETSDGVKFGIYNIEKYPNGNKIGTLMKKICDCPHKMTLKEINERLYEGLAKLANNRAVFQVCSDKVENFFTKTI